jgi:hypothetical protein
MECLIKIGNVTLYQLSYAREPKKQPDFTKLASEL